MSIYIGEFAFQEEELASEVNPEQQAHYTANHSVGKKLAAERNDAMTGDRLF